MNIGYYFDKLVMLRLILIMAFFSLYFDDFDSDGAIFNKKINRNFLVKSYSEKINITSGVSYQNNSEVFRQVKVSCVISGNFRGSQIGSKAAMNMQVNDKEQLFNYELAQKTKQSDCAALHNILRIELANFNSEIDEQNHRIFLLERTVRRYKELSIQDYIFKELLQQVQQDILIQRIRLEGLERERVAVRLNLNELLNNNVSSAGN